MAGGVKVEMGGCKALWRLHLSDWHFLFGRCYPGKILDEEIGNNFRALPRIVSIPLV